MALASQVRREEIHALFRQAGAVLWANVAVSGILAGTLLLAPAASDQPRTGVLLWLGALALLTLARLRLQRSYLRAKPQGEDVARWGARFVAASISSGLLWGGAGFFFFEPGNVPAQALLTFVIGGMTAAAAGTLSCHLPAFFGYFACALAPLALRTLLEGGQLHIGMGAMMLAYAVGMQHVARNNHRAFSRAFRLGLENAELVQQLSGSQRELEEGNQRLEEGMALRTVQLEQHHFRVELPAVARASEAPALSSVAPGHAQHATILVVDDEASLRSVMRRTLLRAGFEVLLAEDGARALALASSHAGHIDLLLTDVVMPGLSGPELARRLREERPEIGVLFVSGYSFEENVPAPDAASGTAYLAKPFDSTTLTAKVHHLLEARGARSEPGLARPA
jgi:CheY-like chemotaxis protein